MNASENALPESRDAEPLHSAEWNMRSRVTNALSVGLDVLRDPEAREKAFARAEEATAAN